MEDRRGATSGPSSKKPCNPWLGPVRAQMEASSRIYGLWQSAVEPLTGRGLAGVAVVSGAGTGDCSAWAPESQGSGGSVAGRAGSAVEPNALRSPRPAGDGFPTVVRRSRKGSRGRQRGRRGPERFDADYYLRKLEHQVVTDLRKSGATDMEVGQAIAELRRKTSEELAEELQRRFRVRRHGRTIRRNSKLYREWERHRRTGEISKPFAHKGRLRVRKAASRSECADAAVVDGELSQRQSRKGGLRGGRSRKERQIDKSTDAWLRENGVDPSDFRAE
jgi:hypothetical protein